MDIDIDAVIDINMKLDIETVAVLDIDKENQLFFFLWHFVNDHVQFRLNCMRNLASPLCLEYQMFYFFPNGFASFVRLGRPSFAA